MVREFATRYFEEEKKVLDSIPLNVLEDVVTLLQGAYEEERRVFVFGNGGSGSTASHFACDMNKGVCFGIDRKFKVLCLNDSIPTMLAYANDCSYADIFVEQLKNFLQPGDVVIGISGSGNSENVVRAIRYANEIGAKSVALSGFDGGRLAEIANWALVVPIHDMQKVEDVHLILTHVIMQFFCQKLR